MTFWSCNETAWLERYVRLISMFYDVTAWLANNCNTHIVQYSRSRGRMKFGQLTKCNMRNIFLEKSYPKCDGEISPRPFSEKLKLSISLDHYTVCLYNVCQVEGYWNINWLSFIIWLPLLREILDNICIGLLL